MTHPFSAVSCRRWISGVLAVLIGLGPLATPTYAALTQLADEPINVQNKAQPNIMLTVDDSTSMLFDFLPDNVIGNYCRDITGKMAANCGFGGQNTNLTVAGRGKFVSPGYISQQASVPFGAYNSSFDNSGPGAGCTLATRCSLTHENCSTADPNRCALGAAGTCQADMPNRCSVSHSVCSTVGDSCGVGAGTCETGATCSAGIDPGPLPGLERYPNPSGPPPGKSPLAGQAYEYWTLWPAPVHNAEFNHVYYNPRLTYLPPVDAAGNDYPQMDSLHTTGWTHVPADPWSSPVRYVDLTAPVTVGLWCNSDWSVGHESDPGYCRTNGTGPTAGNSSAASSDGDYNYPWAPPGINPGNGPSTALAIAQSKVGVGNVWGTAQDAKYYYENDNILWCDTTKAEWPHHGPLLTQTCDGFSSLPQTCVGTNAQSCDGGASQSCDNLPNNCSPGTPNSCLGVGPSTCGGGNAPHCATGPQSCSFGAQTCDPGHPQTCVGYFPQTCGPLSGQSCVLPAPQSCNVSPGACILPNPATCPTVWVPTGCDSAPPGEEPPDCHTETLCPPGSCNNGNGGISCTDNGPCPDKGSCSSDGLPCTNSPNSCALQPGHCAVDTATQCFDNGPCLPVGQCTGDLSACHNNPGDCPTTDGHCSRELATHCQNLPGQCLPTTECSLTGLPCSTPGPNAPECPVQPGSCSVTGAYPCYDDHTCPDAGTCSGTAGQVCTDDSTCPNVLGFCSGDGQQCDSSGPNTCLDTGHCSLAPNGVCHGPSVDPAECPDQNGACTFGEPCNGTLACPDHGRCHDTPTISCTPGSCPLAGAQCHDDSSPCFPGAFACKSANGTCNLDPSHPACTQAFAAGFYETFACPNYDTLGTCSGDNTRHCTSNAAGQCPPMSSPSDAATCSDLLATTVTATVAVANPGFEVPFMPDWSYGPFAGNPWTFVGYAGIQRYNGSFGAIANSGDGSQTAFLQADGSMSQTLTLSPGSYRLSFSAARWLYQPGPYDPVQVSVDGVPVGSPITPTGDYQFSQFSVEFAIASAGSHTIALAGTNSAPNYAVALIDAVTLTQGKTLLEDANSTGIVCRHNNYAGAGYPASGRFTYPDSSYNTPVTAGSGASACTASPRYALIPHHYWKTSVEYCNAQIGTAGDKWLGYGDGSIVGSCHDARDDVLGFSYPRFYKFGEPAGTDNVATPAFQRIDMDAVVNPTFDHGLDLFGDPIQRTFLGAPSFTPDKSEMTNYANWFAYYRTRITAVKTATSLAFKEIDSKYRVGFETLVDKTTPVDIPPAFLNIAQFDPSQKTNWYAKLFGVTIPLGNETPTLQAMVRVGEYYRTGTHPRLLPTTIDPIILSCSKNFHLLFTDGFTNESGVPTDVAPGDVDNSIPDYPYRATFPIIHPVPLVLGAPWPPPFRENTVLGVTTPTSDSLSDYAMHYWLADFQNARGHTTIHNVLPSDTDPATWQHQNFAAVSLGTTGKLPAGQQSVTEASLATGALQWPVPYPSVFKPDNSGVDDLWHAAINGRGQFVNAESVDEVKLGIGQVLADIAAQSGARTGAGLQSTSIGASSNFVYRATFEPGWAGSLTKVQIDPHTGLQVAEVWNAATQLAAQLVPAAAPNDKPWFTNRKIVTMNQAGTAVPFLWVSLGADQRDSLFPPNTFSKVARENLVLEFLRGSAANEGTRLGQFRKRSAGGIRQPLGDIVDTSPVYVGRPNAAYRDGDDPGYSTFRNSAAMATRPARVYVSANDGMLHAFDDANGNETWAYVPSPLYRGGTESYRILEDPLAGDAKAGLGALAYQTGALPPFKHHYMVDGPLKIVDVDFGSAHWHTILVGGMGKGGNRYFALDITNPADITSEATAAGKVLWEFSDAQMGFSYGKPMITKTKAFDGAWLVIVASGYNNPDGHGYLYFIRASDGHLMKTMTTSSLDSGSSTTPSGLAHPAGYTQDFRNQLAEQIYAGDLLGDFWRFDINDTDDSHWTVGKMARLLDSGDHPQPVTTPPQIEVDVTNGVDRWVFVGTGKLYDDSDIADLQQQTMYAFRDGTQTAPVAFPGPFPLTRHTAGMQLLPHTVGTQFGLASKPDKGWFDDLPTGATLGQRIVVPPQAALTVVAYVGTSPQNDPCLTGQTANIYARNFSTGATLLFDGGGTALESFASAEGAVGLEIVGFDTAPGASQPDLRLAITLGTTGEVRFVNVTWPPNLVGHRMSWRLLGQ